MLVIPVSELVEGDKLGRGLFAADGRLMLKQGSTLNKRLIEGIKTLGHRYVIVEETTCRSSNNNPIRTLMDAANHLLRQVSMAVHQGTKLPVDAILQWADCIAETVDDTDGLILRHRDLEGGGTNWGRHSVNVWALSMLTAKELGYSPERLATTAIGSLLHDIGLALPYNDSLMQHHPSIGYEYLRKYTSLPQSALRIVLQHHEQIDGRGFPYGIAGEALSEAAQICGLASDFDHFINDIAKDRPPGEGLEMAKANTGTRYGIEVVRAFLPVFHPYPIGTEVNLSGGLKGRVHRIAKEDPSRPVVRLFDNASDLDLMEQVSLRIEQASKME